MGTKGTRQYKVEWWTGECMRWSYCWAYNCEEAADWAQAVYNLGVGTELYVGEAYSFLLWRSVGNDG